MRFADFASAVQPLDVARGDRVARMRPHSGDARIECGGAASQRIQRQRRRNVGRVHGNFGFAQRESSEREHRLSAVEHREAFFCFEHQRRDSGRAHRFARRSSRGL